MKIVLFTLFIVLAGITFSQKNTTDSQCFYVKNNLSINDEEPWRIVYSDKCPLQKFNFKLYNRWGNILFEASSLTEANSFNPFSNQKTTKNFETGTYFWTITFSLKDDKNTYNEQGSLTILH
jgi:hypothetical protein